METTNRLAHEKSPYLLQHAHNPVDWYPWGDEAFARARTEDKPIFLSIGYSTCHWCHVMAHESFEDPKTAAVMNELFVNVKLDREERPDVDRVYMTFVQATTGGGGWPMSVWLQPDLKPIVGGTYFPPDDRYGRRGFASVCRTVADAWRDEREKIVAQGERIIGALRDHTQTEAPAVSTTAPDPQSIDGTMREALRPFTSTFDPEYGGFGDAPKFPRPVTLTLLARIHARLAGRDPAESARARDMMLATLDGMAAGGMHDHLGGGFHRYSVDRFWHVPHFEKMLYDQAQLAIAYLEAYQITGEQRYADVMHKTLAYVAVDLRSPEGAFYCGEDADSLLRAGHPEHAEGAFYVWTFEEIHGALTEEEAALVCERYGVRPEGNAPPGSDPHGELTGKNVLHAGTAPVGPDKAAVLLTAERKLLELRANRPRPHLDDKILTAWNGLMISAFARANQVFGGDDYLDHAKSAARFVREHLYRDETGVLLRSYREGPSRVEGFADDYAFLIQGLLDLYEADFDIENLVWAERLQDKQDELFYDAHLGGYFASSGRDPNLLLRLKEAHDGAEPSASSVSALNLVRLAAMTGRDEYRERAAATALAFGASSNPLRSAQTMPLMLAAVDSLTHPPRHLVLAGQPWTTEFRAFLRVLHSRYSPNKVMVWADGGAGQRLLARRLSYLGAVAAQDGKPTVYFCADGVCQLPTTDAEALIRQLTTP